MGGYGSGRPWGRSKAEDMLRLDILRLYKKGCLDSGYWTWRWQWSSGQESIINIIASEGQIRLSFRARSGGDEWESVEQDVSLDWTPCHFGGTRPWFHCPRCGRRVGVLYGGKRFYCRTCHRLAYRCQSETTSDRILRQAHKIRGRLEGEIGALSIPAKPKWMRWKTYDRILSQSEELYERSIILAMGQFRIKM